MEAVKAVQMQCDANESMLCVILSDLLIQFSIKPILAYINIISHQKVTLQLVMDQHLHT